MPTFIAFTITYLGFAVSCIVRESQLNSPLLRTRILICYLLCSTFIGLSLRHQIYPEKFIPLLSLTASFFLCFSSSLHLEIKKQKTKLINMYRRYPKIFCVYFGALIIIFGFGSYSAVNTGLTWDEGLEQRTFLKNIDALEDAIEGDDGYFDLEKYHDRYYGIGFYFPAYFFHKPFDEEISRQYSVDKETAVLLSRHLAVFWLFILSGLFVLKIMYLMTNSFLYSCLVSVAYLLYPFMFGHNILNVKDGPFASAWIISSYFLLKIFCEYFLKEVLSKKYCILTAVSLAWLISIRVAGVLFTVFIFVGVIFLLAIYFKKRVSAGKTMNQSIKKILFQDNSESINLTSYSIFLLVVLLTIMFPILWQTGPVELQNAVAYMGKHKWNGLVLTFGEYMPAQNLPVSYIFLWAMVKLPLVALIGLVFIPFGIVKTLRKKDISCISYFIFLLTLSLIIIILIIKNPTLYDELRQILFLVPMVFIVSCATLYYCSKKFAKLLLLVSCVIFISDSIKIFPYQYVWFNEPARFFNLSDNYETDYWGSSGRRLANWINRQNYEDICVYSSPFHLYAPFLDKEKTTCSEILNGEIYTTPNRPFLIARYRRGKFDPPEGCEIVYTETINLTFSPYAYPLGDVWRCENSNGS